MPKAENSLNELLYDIRRISEHREKLSDQQIRAIYKDLNKNLNSYVAEEYVKYADENGQLYMSYLDAQNQRAKFLQEIADNVDGVTIAQKQVIFKLIDETYSKSYSGMVTALKDAEKNGKFAEVVKDLAVQPDVLKQSVNNNVSKLTLPAVLEKHRGDIIYQIQQELTTGLINGDRYEKMAKRISERCNVAYSKAMNITRTETHRNVESGFMDCAERLQDDFSGSDLIYAATWCTMEDERVRPQRRYKTKKGWKTKLSKNGANHVKMNGVTVKAGEMFDLGGGVKAKAPSKSGVAAHDCNCRCYLEYNLLTPEEFAEKAGMKLEKVESKYKLKEKAIDDETRQFMNDNGIADLELEHTQRKEQFSDAMKKAKVENKYGDCVDLHPMKDYLQYDCFLSKNGMACVAVKPDGDITCVVKNDNFTVRNGVNDLIITARANGGTKMDCYGKGLVNKYERCGYVPVAQVDFNPEFASGKLLQENKPKIYFLKKNDDDLETVIKKNAKNEYHLSTQEELDNLKHYDEWGYDEAWEYRDKQLKK